MVKLSSTPIRRRDFLLKGPLPFILAYALAVLSPLIIARLLGIEHEPGKREVAIGSGMVALMLLLSAFLLSGRFNWIAGKRGLDLTLKFHRRVAMVALLFALVHIFMIAPFSMPDSMGLAGIPILLFLVVAVMAKIHSKVKLKYEIWRLTHGVLAMIIVAMLTAHAVIDGTYSSHPVLAVYWIVLTIVAILSLFYVHQYLPRKEGKRPYQVVAVTEEANQQWTVTMEPEGFDAMSFAAGQYAFVSFGSSPFKDRAHPFSFSSPPSERPRISFTIKAVGDFTRTVGDIEVGSKAYLYGPYGHMSREQYRGPENTGRGSVMLAAGVGVTPMISMLREMREQDDQSPVKVFYACRHEADMMYRNELEAIGKLPNAEVHLILSQPGENWAGDEGRIDLEYLKQQLNFAHYEDYLYFICGTSAFVRDTAKALDKIGGIPVFNMRFEDFSVYS